MCGLTGFWSPAHFGSAAAARGIVEAMRDRLTHRGPDDHGTWIDAESGIAFGFRRLSIIDLSPAGHQPMASADGRFVAMMNGEIYNFAELRAEIDAARGGHPWRGHSDTEVLVEAIDEWGIERALGRANGMFAIAVWDRRENSLSLARDRIGKKPMYYGWMGGHFLFGSELKALRAHPAFDGRLSTEALSGFLQIGYVVGRRTIFAGLSKLPGGHILRLDARAAGRRESPEPSPYWDLRGVAENGLDAQAAGRPAQQEEFEALLRDSVALRMVADVPVGSFLSGGIDSSLVTALMAKGSAGAVHSFAIGFNVREWDEAPHARAVAEHLGTQHEEAYLGAADIQDMIRDIAEVCDEPLADDSIVPTTLLCRLARRQVTVALSGDGGDELLAGYARYAAVNDWLERRQGLPRPVRALASLVSGGLAPAAERLGQMRVARRLRLLDCLMGSGDPDEVHRMLVSQTLEADSFLASPAGLPNPLEDPRYLLGRSTPIDRMGFTDLTSYLTDDILAKVDRASMSTSLEVRCPLLDYRVIEMSWRFPTAAKYAAGEGKLPLRQLLYRHVPRALVDRPKRGFGAPVEVWLRDELRDWAETLMSPAALARHGLLDVRACRKLWEDFLHRNHSFNRVIWNLLMFQAWHASLDHARPQPFSGQEPWQPDATDARAAADRFVPN
ncbi:asparagine synthase (glutamine-hydrolyzing) [Roseomonas sp. KE2513]|uniref:asparagine synthase (glutamine-hydrolyzing) n=1 Tax=Roseomonas sp. KE2513 TaxID=2479202 RepID=UPI0018DF25A3|nr:asparagine synthase (glutamine-hydrolyzing) [Roseomonas sp. KE2513]MBI0535533.1 asparagine synthase (glutamine-hydrolyzing) [Roseomonas sp. KE2513]